MRKLISIGLIVAILAIMIVSALAGGMPSDPITPPPPPSYYTTAYFNHYQSGVSIDGWVRAYETPDRKVKVYFHARSLYSNHYIMHLQLVVALWSEGKPVLYRTYDLQDIAFDDEYWDVTIYVKEDGITASPDWGFAYVKVTGVGITEYLKPHAIKFINGAAPEIYPQTLRCVGLWDMLHRFQQMPTYYG